MRRAIRLGYAAVASLARVAAALAPPGRSKVVRSIAARRGIRGRFRRWAATHRDAERPLLWMHAPSVGEGLQARPVLEIARARRPDIQLAYTFFSPSAERFAASLDVDFRDYLPFDTAADARAALDALQPRALVFSKLDVWPTLVRQAHRRGVRLGMISATLARESSRRSGPASALLREAYAMLDAVGAIDDDDAERLVALGVRPAAVEITGDTRYDQVWARAMKADRASPLLAAFADARPTLVAGSTWPADEEFLLPAILGARELTPGLRAIVAPHEPDERHLAPIEQWCSEHDVSIARLGTVAASTADLVLVDRVGVLGDLYALASVAFVGGGNHAAGLHSVLEPAAFGAPVVFGPLYEASRDARLLVQTGGGASASSTSELTAQFREWLTDPAERDIAGERARALVRSGLGAADRSFALVERLLD